MSREARRRALAAAVVTAAWWLPALVPAAAGAQSATRAALELVAWWALLGVAAAAIGGREVAAAVWLGVAVPPAAGDVAVLVTGVARPGWLDWAGHGLAVIALACLLAIPAMAALHAVRTRTGLRAGVLAGGGEPLGRGILALLPGTACLVPPILLTSPNDQVLGTLACGAIGVLAGAMDMVGLRALWVGAAVLPLASAASNAAGVGLPGPTGLPIESALGLIGFVLLAATPGHVVGTEIRAQLASWRLARVARTPAGDR